VEEIYNNKGNYISFKGDTAEAVFTEIKNLVY
jgi:hypothetical protein